MTRLPISSNNGRARLNASVPPPTIIASVPSIAPVSPPETGASRYSSTALGQARGDPALGLGRDGAHIDHDLAFCQHRFDLRNDALDVRRIRHHDEDDVRAARRLGRVGSDDRTFSGECAGLFGGAIMDAHAMLPLQQPARHRRTHYSGPDPCNFHVQFLLNDSKRFSAGRAVPQRRMLPR